MLEILEKLQEEINMSRTGSSIKQKVREKLILKGLLGHCNHSDMLF
jgi:hypothetical protein